MTRWGAGRPQGSVCVSYPALAKATSAAALLSALLVEPPERYAKGLTEL